MAPDNSKPELSDDNQIVFYHNCKLCFDELPVGESLATYARYNTGWTQRGLQVWCVRHNANILNIDFEGCKHPAITSRKG